MNILLDVVSSSHFEVEMKYHFETKVRLHNILENNIPHDVDNQPIDSSSINREQLQLDSKFLSIDSIQFEMAPEYIH